MAQSNLCWDIFSLNDHNQEDASAELEALVAEDTDGDNLAAILNQDTFVSELRASKRYLETYFGQPAVVGAVLSAVFTLDVDSVSVDMSKKAVQVILADMTPFFDSLMNDGQDQLLSVFSLLKPKGADTLDDDTQCVVAEEDQLPPHVCEAFYRIVVLFCKSPERLESAICFFESHPYILAHWISHLYSAPVSEALSWILLLHGTRAETTQ
ncbi:hypothetical protein KIPB_000597, partial [Kipferlia bialata]|eukprot:g597.t1